MLGSRLNTREPAQVLYGIAIGILAIVAAIVPVSESRAHPHVWVTVQTKVLFDDSGSITGFRHTWIFDEYYTAFALQGMDANGDGDYSAEELQPLAKTNVESLSEFDYFTFAKLEGTAVPREDPVDYSLKHENGLLALRFTIPLAEPVPAAKAGQFTFSVYDPTYFVSFSLAKADPIQLAASAPAGCGVDIAPSPTETASSQTLGEAFYNNLDPSQDWGAQFAREVALTCKPAS